MSSVRADVNSGPTVGETPPALMVLALTGDEEYQELDYRDDRKEKPTVYVFIRADRFDRPMARFLKALDEKVKTVSDEADVIAIWRSEDAQTTREYLPRAKKSLQFRNTTLAYFPAGSSGPNDWAITGEAFLTAVVVHEGKVAASLGYVSVNETEVPKVVEALKKAIGK
jgi:hypothetical protein